MTASLLEDWAAGGGQSELQAPGTTPVESLVVVGSVLAVAMLAALVASALWWLRYRERPPGVEFRDRLESADAVAVLAHPRPDPDAMASALAVASIAEWTGTPATIQYPGEIRHPENRAFLTVLDLRFERVETASDLAADTVVLVDHGEPRGFEGAERVRPDLVVDHHPDGDDRAAFADVRTDYGACATILAEYLETLGAVVDDETPVERRRYRGNTPVGDGLTVDATLATALALGVLSDTNGLTRGASRAEFAAMEYLTPAVDEALLDRIANPQVDAGVLEAQARAVLERDQRTPYVVSDVGGIDNLDAVPQAAEELLSLEGVTAAVVLGERDGTLYLSGRSRDDRVHVGRALQAAMAELPGAGAGGHARMGGAQVSLEEVDGLRAASGVLQSRDTLTRADLHERLFDALAGQV